MMSDRPRIPGYELIECLGGGSLTCVWSARDLAADEPIAIKLPRRTDTARRIALTFVGRGAAAGLPVRHPNLFRFRSGSLERPPHFLVMDLLNGEPLRRQMQREYRLDVAAALWISRQIAQALAALHRAGLVHGDVKPDNVLLIDSHAAIVIDLGLAPRARRH